MLGFKFRFVLLTTFDYIPFRASLFYARIKMKQATQVMLWVEKITSIVYEHDHTYFTIEMPMQEVNYTGRIPSKYALFLEDYKPEVYTVWIEGSLSYDNDLPLVDAKKMRFVPKENNQTIMGIEL